MYRIGIDLGGTNTAAGLVDGGRIIDRETVKTNLPTDIDRIVRDITRLCETLMVRNGLTGQDIRSVGVGVPCTGNKQTGWMEDANHLGFPAGPLVEPLQDALSVPVYIENDANAAAWGEYRSGDYAGGSFVLVTLGTGIGGGIILNDRLWNGINNAAGELGHMTIRMDGESCGCGRSGCFETYASATALIRRAREAMAKDRNTLLWQLCGGEIQKVEAKTVFDAAALGDSLAAALLDTYTTCLAEGLANIINILCPATLCIGGGVSHAGDALLVPVREKTRQRVFAKNAEKNTRIVLAKLHNDAGILGAALLDE